MTLKKYSAKETVPKPDTMDGPGLENLRVALGKETDPLAAFNAEKDSRD